MLIWMVKRIEFIVNYQRFEQPIENDGQGNVCTEIILRFRIGFETSVTSHWERLLSSSRFVRWKRMRAVERS